MVSAYILILTEVGRASAVASACRHLEGIETADDVTGPYDVIVRAKARDVDELGRMVVARIQAIEGIDRTLTCTVVNL